MSWLPFGFISRNDDEYMIHTDKGIEPLRHGGLLDPKDYPLLYAAIGQSYGKGRIKRWHLRRKGFRLPDFKGRIR